MYDRGHQQLGELFRQTWSIGIDSDRLLRVQPYLMCEVPSLPYVAPTD